jgi:SOS-response transcriptional repressor LexA
MSAKSNQVSLFERIQERLEVVGMTAREASLRATHGQNADLIRNLKRSRSVGLRGERLMALAAVLDVTPEWLLQMDETRGNGEAPDNGDLMRVPLIAWVSAGHIHLDTIGQETLGEVTEGGLDPAGDWVALRVEGDSMDRISPPGSIIFVDRSDRQLVPNACYVIADEDGGTTYKRYRPSPMRFEPVSTNPAHEPLFPAREPEVFGRVKKSILAL